MNICKLKNCRFRSVIPRVHAYYNTEEIRASLRFWDTSAIERFETAFSRYTRHQYCVLFPYSRTGLLAALDILGIRGKEIIMPAYTCCVVSHAVVKSGNIPRFVDTEKDSFNCSWDSYADRTGASTGAIIGMHLFGSVMKPDCSEKGREKLRGIPIIHDRTLSLGTPFETDDSILKGLCSYYGLSLSKQLCMVEGGTVATDNEKFAKELRVYRDKKLLAAGYLFNIKRYLFFGAHYLLFHPASYGAMLYMAQNSKNINGLISYYSPDTIDLPRDIKTMLPLWQARIGEVQLQKLDSMNALRKKLALEYAEALQGIASIRYYRGRPEECPSHFILMCERRDELVSLARERGIDIGVHFDYVIPELPAYTPFDRGDRFPNAERLADTVSNLPFYPGLSTRNKDKIINVLMEIDGFFSRNTHVRV